MSLLDKIKNLVKSNSNLQKTKERTLSLEEQLEIDDFQKKGVELVTQHMNNSEYSEHRTLIREISFLIYYTFEVLKDDFYKGNKILSGKVTKIDDYVFSSYRKNPSLENNIKKLITVAFSNRFEPRPHDNLLAYYVFLEETGFEITMLYNDFYYLLENGKKLSKNNTYQIDKNEEKPVRLEKTDETLVPETLSEIESPVKAQRKIIEDILNIEKNNLKKKDKEI